MAKAKLDETKLGTMRKKEKQESAAAELEEEDETKETPGDDDLAKPFFVFEVPKRLKKQS